MQSIGNGCGIQIDGFSVQTEPYASFFDDVHYFDNFGFVFDGLMLFPDGPRTLRGCPEGPRTLRECPEVPGTLCECPDQLVATSRDMSGLVATCLDSCGLKGSTLGPYT